MFFRTFTSLLFFNCLFVTSLTAQQKITIPNGKDPVIITADLYLIQDTLPYMILCHQAGSSRAEYMETANRLCKLGFNCISIDLRAGNEIRGVRNETAVLAKSLHKSTDYIDAEQDIVSAVNFIFMKSKKQVVLVGSSYSASLALKIASSNSKVKAVIAFSPGEYFGNKLNIKNSISTLDKPVFVTSTKSESAETSYLIQNIKSRKKTQFIPSYGEGQHGASSLWKENKNEGEYWLALMAFISGSL